MRLASISWTQSRFRWRFKMHCHRLHWKVSLFPHRQQDSKTCHVCCCAGFPALTVAQKVHLPVGKGTCILRTGSNWSRIFHINVENMHLRLLKHIWGLGWLHVFLYFWMFRSRYFNQHYNQCFHRKAAATKASQTSEPKSHLFKLLSWKDSLLWEECGFKPGVFLRDGNLSPVF